jgi:hypothetical protein
MLLSWKVCWKFKSGQPPQKESEPYLEYSKCVIVGQMSNKHTGKSYTNRFQAKRKERKWTCRLIKISLPNVWHTEVLTATTVVQFSSMLDSLMNCHVWYWVATIVTLHTPTTILNIKIPFQTAEPSEVASRYVRKSYILFIISRFIVKVQNNHWINFHYRQVQNKCYFCHRYWNLQDKYIKATDELPRHSLFPHKCLIPSTMTCEFWTLIQYNKHTKLWCTITTDMNNCSI